MKHHISKRHLQTLAKQNHQQQIHKSNQSIDPYRQQPISQSTNLIQHLNSRTKSFTTSVRIAKDVQRWRKIKSTEFKIPKPSMHKCKSLMKQIITKPSVSVEHQRSDTLSAVGLNEEIIHTLNSKQPSKLLLLSYLHRMRQRDSPNINFLRAFQGICVDNEKTKITMLTWKSVMAASFKSVRKNEAMKLLEVIFEIFEIKWEGHSLSTKRMDVRFPLAFLRVRSNVYLSSNPTTIAGSYHKKLSTTVPVLMEKKEFIRTSNKFLYIVWNVLCFHQSYVTGKDFNQALLLLAPHLTSLFDNETEIRAFQLKQMQRTLTQYQCRIITFSLWNLTSNVEKCSQLVKNLIESQEKFIHAFIPMRLSSVELKYRFNKIRPVFKAWRKHYDWVVAVRFKVLSVKNNQRKKALWHFYEMTHKGIRSKNYWKKNLPIARMKWLSICFHRVRRITSRLRDYKITKLEKMSLIFFRRIHVPNCFRWWIDVHQEDGMLLIAARYKNEVVRKHWFCRLKKYVQRQVKDRKLDYMREQFRKQEQEELLIVDQQNTFFLSQEELKARQKRVELHNQNEDEKVWEQKWDIERKKAGQGQIRIHQARERIAHRIEKQEEAKKHRSDVWDTMESNVLPRIIEKARHYCLHTPNGKKYIKEKVNEMFQTSMAECQSMLYRGTFNIEGCIWQAINEVTGVMMSPVAWSCVSTGESVKYQKMTSSIARKISIERHIALEVLKVKIEFQNRREQEDEMNKQEESALMCQSAFRMRQGRKKAMVVFQTHWITLIDCNSGVQMYYNLNTRMYQWHKPHMLHRGEVVTRFSTFNARGPDAEGTYWYEYRPLPYRPENAPKESVWVAPVGILLCERCNIAIVRRKCLGEGCVLDRSCQIYLCLFCYDDVHPIEDVGDMEIDSHRLHEHVDYACPNVETFNCCICSSKSSTKYCRDGDCYGNLYCDGCWLGVHGHERDAWHVADVLKK